MAREKGFRLLSEDDSSITVIDARGIRVKVDKFPERVMPLYTSFLKLWYECGGKAVARPSTRSAHIPEEARGLPSVGHTVSPNLEKVLNYKPDLILLKAGFSGHKGMIPVLKSANIPFLMLDYQDFDDYQRLVRIFTRLTDRRDIREDTLERVQQSVESIVESLPADKQPRVLILFGSTSFVKACLPDSPVGKMVSLLKGENIAYDADISNSVMQPFSMERVVERNPEVILIQTMGKPAEVEQRVKKEFISDPTWNTISAVRNSRVHYLPLEGFLYKPNKMYPKIYRYIAELLYPGMKE